MQKLNLTQKGEIMSTDESHNVCTTSKTDTETPNIESLLKIIPAAMASVMVLSYWSFETTVVWSFETIVIGPIMFISSWLVLYMLYELTKISHKAYVNYINSTSAGIVVGLVFLFSLTAFLGR